MWGFFWASVACANGPVPMASKHFVLTRGHDLYHHDIGKAHSTNVDELKVRAASTQTYQSCTVVPCRSTEVWGRPCDLRPPPPGGVGVGAPVDFSKDPPLASVTTCSRALNCDGGTPNCVFGPLQQPA